jgi:hypothetical protein
MATKQVTINGKTYHLGQLAHSKARETFFILLRNLGPGMGELIAQLASGGKLADLNLDPRALGRAIQDVCLRLNDADAAAVSEAFGSVTVVVAKGAKVELTPKAQERHFQGALGEWLEWLGHAVAWNYADFLE